MKSSLLLLLFALLLSSAALVARHQYLGYPFQGPGFDPDRQAVTGLPPGTTATVAITYGLVDPGKGNAFLRQLRKVLGNLPDQEGLIGYAVRKQMIGREVWTLSAWESRDSLERFVASPAHREAIRAGGIPRDRVRSVIIESDIDDLPLSWEEAVALLEESE